MPIPVAMRLKAQVCGRSIVGIAGSNPDEGMDVRLVCLLCAAWVAASSSGQPYRVCDLETSAMRWLDSELGCCTKKKKGGWLSICKVAVSLYLKLPPSIRCGDKSKPVENT